MMDSCKMRSKIYELRTILEKESLNKLRNEREKELRKMFLEDYEEKEG